MSKKTPTSKLQLILEIFVLAGFGIGLFPFGYLLVLWWVIPLTIVNAVLSIVGRNGTTPFTLVNVVMGILSVIPILGFFPRVIGILMAALSINKLRDQL